jgi:hypothetical protein
MLKRLSPFAAFAALVIGFGMMVWISSNAPHSSINPNASSQQQRSADAKSPKESIDEAIARYNKWLAVFTGVLAIATVGLGVATAGLYFAGERQLAHIESAAEAEAFYRQGQMNKSPNKSKR